MLAECGELLRREDPVTLGYELTDLLPVRVAGEHHHDAITAGSRGEERVANGEQRLAFVWAGPQHEQRNGRQGWTRWTGAGAAIQRLATAFAARNARCESAGDR